MRHNKMAGNGPLMRVTEYPERPNPRQKRFATNFLSAVFRVSNESSEKAGERNSYASFWVWLPFPGCLYGK